MAPIGTILSIGQGKRTVPELVTELRRHGVEYLLDVRSAPYSKFRPEFSRPQLEAALREQSLHYAFFGDSLGGRPRDPACYDNEGYVDYTRVRTRDFFQKGLERLKQAREKGFTVALFCSEGDPSRCHRCKLIGAALLNDGIAIEHITVDGLLASQSDVMREITKGEPSLVAKATKSRKSYR